MNSRSSASTALLLICGLAATIVTTASAHIPIPPKKGEIGKKTVNTAVPDFTLVDQNGKRFRFADARGKLIVATFIFTTCPDVCPLLSAKFAAIQRALDEKGARDYLLLSITTDPEIDTSAVLQNYAERYKADSQRWLFLTGSRAQLAKVWSDFGVNVKKFAPGQVQHTALTTVIDREGRRRFDYYTDKWHERSVLSDLESLAVRRR
jgi:protein SCO1/2